ncbi:colanic acid capsular biosynthesis activation protein A [Cedecea lapagei]|uniref:Colanic acid capsular biosynthesis activation protein A n=1 Tax=Cedecea lapagei TaxID=158823 RepID=A0A3S4J5H9_9ENTR|nr:LuxR C-terminal-related transcriptional regulator [Cedecea lapagei]VEC01309.1 colanic acid capsular biosynthesis activation protein A [Cedecea lapagei]
MYKILLVDRCYFSRQGLTHLLNQKNNLATAMSILETDSLLLAREKIIKWQPNMVIADFNSFSTALHNIQQLSTIYSACGDTTRLLLLQSGHHPTIAEYCAAQGSTDIWDKSLSLAALADLIQQMIAARPPFREVKRHITPLLTLREEKILKLWKEEAKNEYIARVMGISIKTVYTYKRNIRLKLGADNRLSLFLNIPEAVLE